MGPEHEDGWTNRSPPVYETGLSLRGYNIDIKTGPSMGSKMLKGMVEPSVRAFTFSWKLVHQILRGVRDADKKS